jgi:TctA family transporter
MSFGAAEYFSLMLLGLIAAVVLASGTLLKTIAMVVVGMVIGVVGTDVNSGAQRLTFGIIDFNDGIDFVVVAMGVFGFGEILTNLGSSMDRVILDTKIRRALPSLTEVKQSYGAVLRGTGIGSLLGVLPGAGAILASFISYMIEKRIAQDPSRFGRGAIEGVAAPEAANNAAAQTGFIPLLTLGIPGSAVMALMIGAMTMQGIAPGPQVIQTNPELFWGLIASMWIGNLLLVLLNLPLIGVWIKLLKVPYRLLYLLILCFACIGIYTVNYSWLDVVLAAFFGVIGALFMKLRCEPAPLLLGLILGPMMEENLRRAMLLSRGDPMIFLTRPLSLAMLLLAIGLIVSAVLPSIRVQRQQVFVEDT